LIFSSASLCSVLCVVSDYCHSRNQDFTIGQ
jgi:hypothetical protein